MKERASAFQFYPRQFAGDDQVMGMDLEAIALKSSVEFKSTEMPECSLEQVGEWLATSYLTHKAEKGERASDPLKYFQQAMYSHSSRKPAGATHLSVNDPAAYARAAMEGD